MHATLTSLLDSYGYVALFLLVALESLGIPLPGETALVTTAAFAAAGHLSLSWVVTTAAAAAIIGDNSGYWIGRAGGLRFVRRYGRMLHIRDTEIERAHAFFARRGVLDMVLKHLIQRPRPVYASAFLHSASWSFPSGHAMEALIGYGMLTYLLVVFWAERRRTQLTIVLVAALLTGAIGISRLYLGVHYFSDVVAGYAAGPLWLSACITGLEMARRQRGTAPSWDESR